MAPNVFTRRQFMKTTGASVTVGAGATLLAASAQAAGSNERLRIGVIGPGRRGFGTHVKTLAGLRKLGRNIDMVGVCDVYTVHRDQAVHFIKSETGVAPETFADYRDMLARDDIDAVCIATPDHWHAKMTIDALAAGKHIYCEK
ncbi:MAG: Gfo/Idh/MocA family oxidoreductase, partial [Planctomycetaceae bacterium]|nr:Gfo/Idh/MocA family oxidoreductase [Planctomycetaceae bacterium]